MFADHDHADCIIEITGRSFIFFLSIGGRREVESLRNFVFIG